MPIDRESELHIRAAIAEMIGAVPEVGYVRPAPQYFNTAAAFWAAVEPSISTQKEIEKRPINATWLYPISIRDDPTSGCVDSPLTYLTYEIYTFAQYGEQRENTEDVAVFENRVLKAHADFVAGWLGIKEQFQRYANIAGLDADFVTAQTQPTVQIEPTGNAMVCEFIPRVVGYAVRQQETVRLKQAG